MPSLSLPTRSVRLALASFVLAGVAALADAEHVELTIALSAVPGDIVTTLGGATATVIFDTDASPIDSTAQSVTFAGVAGRIDGVLFAVDPVTNPSAANPAPVQITGPIDGSELVYSQAGDRNIIVRLFLGDATVTLTVFSPAGVFSPAMTSLPDMPTAYVVQDETDYRVFGNLLSNGLGVFASIDRSGAFVIAIGGVSYNARLVSAPVLPPCNEADLAQPFGQLDFDDVLAFLIGFGAMDLSSDLATPTCVFDFADVLAFLTAYGAGCP